MNNLMLRVVDERHRLGLTIAEIAYRSRLSIPTIYLFEANARAGRTCLLSTLERVAEAVGLRVTISSESKVAASSC